MTGNPPEIQLVPESQDCTSITMNMKLLLAALNPLDLEAWSQSNWLQAGYQLVKCPLDILFRLTIPVVDREKPRDNWVQYMAIIQCVLGPVFSVFAVNVGLDKLGDTNLEVWHITLISSILLAILVGFTSRSSQPRYHNVFAFIGFVISIVWSKYIIK